ncbi:contractile injection system protein, VgrG/Pvc8 family, partial [Planctomycetota bacterium]
MAVDLSAPAYKIFVGKDKEEVKKDVYADVLAVECHEGLDVSDMILITLANKRCKYSSGKFFTEGKRVRVEMGYVDHTETIVTGEIVALETSFPLSGTDQFVVRCYDASHRLRYGKRRRGWNDSTYKDVILEVAGDCKLTVDFYGKPPEQKFFWVFQNNESDIDFLRRIIREIGYEFTIESEGEKDTLVVSPPATGGGKVATIEWGMDLKSFAPRLSTHDQVSKVVVRGWNPKTKTPIIGKAEAKDLLSKMEGKEVGLEKSKTITKILQNPVFDIKEAEAIAKAELNERALRYLTGRGTAVGNPKLRAGKVVELVGLGELFNGNYYIVETIHTFQPNAGYATGFRVARPAWGLKAEQDQTGPKPTGPDRTGPTAAPQTGPTSGPKTGPTSGPETGPTCSPETGPTCSPETGPTCSPETGPTCSPETGP